MTEFENTLLARVDKMGSDFQSAIAELTERITSFEGKTEKALSDLSGRIKGNHELLEKDLQTYVNKESCETHRERQGIRFKELEDRMLAAEMRLDDQKQHIAEIQNKEKDKGQVAAERVTAWLPTIIFALIVVGGIIWVNAQGITGG